MLKRLKPLQHLQPLQLLQHLQPFNNIFNFYKPTKNGTHKIIKRRITRHCRTIK